VHTWHCYRSGKNGFGQGKVREFWFLVFVGTLISQANKTWLAISTSINCFGNITSIMDTQKENNIVHIKNSNSVPLEGVNITLQTLIMTVLKQAASVHK